LRRSSGETNLVGFCFKWGGTRRGKKLPRVFEETGQGRRNRASGGQNQKKKTKENRPLVRKAGTPKDGGVGKRKSASRTAKKDLLGGGDLSTDGDKTKKNVIIRT